MRIRIIKAPPAPRMDGFDLRGLRAGNTYDVEPRTAKYLLVAGYAERDRPDKAADKTGRK